MKTQEEYALEIDEIVRRDVRVARMTGLGLTGRYLCNRKTGIRYLFLEPGRPDVI